MKKERFFELGERALSKAFGLNITSVDANNEHGLQSTAL